MWILPYLSLFRCFILTFPFQIKFSLQTWLQVILNLPAAFTWLIQLDLELTFIWFLCNFECCYFRFLYNFERWYFCRFVVSRILMLQGTLKGLLSISTGHDLLWCTTKGWSVHLDWVNVYSTYYADCLNISMKVLIFIGRLLPLSKYFLCQISCL